MHTNFPQYRKRFVSASHRCPETALLFILGIGLPVIRAADYVEIRTELNATWEIATQTNHRSETATCTVGTNGWFISGDFLVNAEVDYWLVGTNVIEQKRITSSMYLEQAKDRVEKLLRHEPPSPMSYPRAGEKFTRVHPSPQGQPAGTGIANAVWLAFCSGTYLKHASRQVPLPVGPSSLAFGYSDKTVVFPDTLGLPKTVELYATDGQLVCAYEVLETTNFLGRTFPLKFRLIQYGQSPSGALNDSKSTVLGRVTSIQIGNEPTLPDEVRKVMEKRVLRPTSQ